MKKYHTSKACVATVVFLLQSFDLGVKTLENLRMFPLHERQATFKVSQFIFLTVVWWSLCLRRSRHFWSPVVVQFAFSLLVLHGAFLQRLMSYNDDTQTGIHHPTAMHVTKTFLAN